MSAIRAAICRAALLGVIVTDVNSHGAVQAAKRAARQLARRRRPELWRRPAVAPARSAGAAAPDQRADGGVGKRGLIEPGWVSELPNRSVPYTSTGDFVVPTGNPEVIRGWPDLIVFWRADPLGRGAQMCHALGAMPRRSPLPVVSRRTLGRGVVLGLAAAGLGPWARASESEVVRFGLAVHVPLEEGRPVADDAFVERQVATANRIFAPHAVAFERRERHELEARHARMESRADRDALGELVRQHVVNVFVVASLRDVDDPKRMRRGVHWRSTTHAPAHYVIVSRISFDAVLAHELGHFFGNRRHSQTPGNLMSYQHGDVLPFLDGPQQRRLRGQIATYLRTGELRRLEPEPAR